MILCFFFGDDEKRKFLIHKLKNLIEYKHVEMINKEIAFILNEIV